MEMVLAKLVLTSLAKVALPLFPPWLKLRQRSRTTVAFGGFRSPPLFTSDSLDSTEYLDTHIIVPQIVAFLLGMTLTNLHPISAPGLSSEQQSTLHSKS
jgi:hypothetical protein